jgi:hypothetical protein
MYSWHLGFQKLQNAENLNAYKTRIFFLQGVHTDSGTHPASYPMGTRDSFPGGTAAEMWSWPLTSI